VVEDEGRNHTTLRTRELEAEMVVTGRETIFECKTAHNRAVLQSRNDFATISHQSGTKMGSCARFRLEGMSRIAKWYNLLFKSRSR
jgi:hypothetical protein